MHYPEETHADLDAAVARLCPDVREAAPDIIQCWGPHGNHLGARVAQLMENRPPVVWSITNERTLDETTDPELRYLMERNAELSHTVPDHIICASDNVKKVYMDMGYAPDKLHVLYNGVDTKRYCPDPDNRVRQEIRRDLSIEDHVPVIAMAARFDAQKDHEGFVRAAALMHKEHPEAQFLLCGTGANWDNPTLRHWITEAGISDATHLLGERDDMERLFHVADIWTSTSRHEAFSNVVIEAMACGKPVVATDAGMTELTVGGIGVVIPRRDPQVEDGSWERKLVDGWQEVLSRSPKEQQDKSNDARQRVLEAYKVEDMAGYYNRLYQQLKRRREGAAYGLQVPKESGGLAC